MTDMLSKLFGSAARVRLLRLFLFNPRMFFSIPDAASRSRVRTDEAREEIRLFSRVGLLERNLRSRTTRYGINGDSPYTLALQNLLLNTPTRASEMYALLRGVGAIKLVVVSGIFVGEWDGRVDVLIVGDRIRERTLQSRIRLLESEIGKEIRYAALTVQDFLYRLNLNDRLIRDVFDYPHRIVHDRLDIGLK